MINGVRCTAFHCIISVALLLCAGAGGRPWAREGGSSYYIILLYYYIILLYYIVATMGPRRRITFGWRA